MKCNIETLTDNYPNISNQTKLKVLAWLPVMIELEKMGVNPVASMFSPHNPNIEEIEAVYVAVNRAKDKDPQWWTVMKKFIAEGMKDMYAEKRNTV